MFCLKHILSLKLQQLLHYTHFVLFIRKTNCFPLYFYLNFPLHLRHIPLQWACGVFIGPDGHRSCKYSVGKGQVFGWLQSAASLQFLRTAPLIGLLRNNWLYTSRNIQNSVVGCLSGLDGSMCHCASYGCYSILSGACVVFSVLSFLEPLQSSTDLRMTFVLSWSVC